MYFFSVNPQRLVLKLTELTNKSIVDYLVCFTSKTAYKVMQFIV